VPEACDRAGEILESVFHDIEIEPHIPHISWYAVISECAEKTYQEKSNDEDI
jgi:hypothetical protein